VRVLSQAELNRAVLARQLLLERAEMPLPRALEQVAGIQAQYAPSMYIGLWARLRDFERDRLTRALERRQVVQATLMRVTIHLVSRRDFWPMAAGVRSARQALWLRTHRDAGDARAMEAAARRLRDRLGHGPLRRGELEEVVGKHRAGGVGLWIDLVRVPPSGTWERRRADLFGGAEEWLGAGETSVEDGTERLVRRYLTGFGPAARSDIANWAGLPVRAIGPVLDRMRLRRLRDEAGAELLDLPGAPLPGADTPAPVRFLPTYDATLLAHARRAGIVPEEHRAKVFSSRRPQSVPTFTVDGSVAGAWRHEHGRVSIEPFERLGAAALRAVREEADRISGFLA
jgi:hypothetical protein